MTDYVSDAQARSLILDVGRRLYHSGFVASNDGNITCKVGDNAIWATPTGVSKGFYDRGNACENGFGRKYTGRHLQAFQRDQNAPSCV